jgi:hypothetical protein
MDVLIDVVDTFLPQYAGKLGRWHQAGVANHLATLVDVVVVAMVSGQ